MTILFRQVFNKVFDRNRLFKQNTSTEFLVVPEAEDNLSHGPVVPAVEQLLGHVLEDEPLDLVKHFFLCREYLLGAGICRQCLLHELKRLLATTFRFFVVLKLNND